MAASLVIPVGALMAPPRARPAACHGTNAPRHAAPPPARPPSIVVPIATPVMERTDRMLYQRAVAEIERLRQALGASDMGLQAARSDAARARIAASRAGADPDAVSAGGSPRGESVQPVPGTMKARPRDPIGGVPGAASADLVARGAAPLVRTIVLQSPRSLIDLFG